MTSRHRPTRLLSRGLLRIMPRHLRDEYGADMVQLTLDRRTHSGEPVWRLWPALVCDTAVVIVRTRLEQLMIPFRALVVGVAFAIATFAVLSGDPVVGLAVGGLAAIGGVVLLGRRRRASATSSDGSARTSGWASWAIVGALLSAGSLVAVAIAGERELSAPAWMSVMGTLLVGLTALATGLILAAQREAR
jgi:hypothetical protein